MTSVRKTKQQAQARGGKPGVMKGNRNNRGNRRNELVSQEAIEDNPKNGGARRKTSRGKRMSAVSSSSKTRAPASKRRTGGAKGGRRSVRSRSR